MKTYACECEKCIAWSTDGPPAPCCVCKECGTTIDGPGFHRAIEQHEYKIKYNEDTGKPSHKRCVKCNRRENLTEEEKG